MPMIYLALGSNVGDSQQNIAQAITFLSAQVKDIMRAPLYRSTAVGYTEQPDFLNTVIQGSTTLSPQKLLQFIHAVESEVGRIQRFRWGPREIDIDIIFYADCIVQEPGLTIPHEYFRQRDFVLKPLSDLLAHMKDPLTGKTVQALLDELAEQNRAIVGPVESE